MSIRDMESVIVDAIASNNIFISLFTFLSIACFIIIFLIFPVILSIIFSFYMLLIYPFLSAVWLYVLIRKRNGKFNSEYQ